MSVERKDVERIAELARLSFNEGEIDRLTEEMGRILAHATTLRGQTELSATDETYERDPREGRNGTRAEEAEVADPLCVPIADVAPRFQEGLFVVPPPPGVHAEAPGGSSGDVE
jgi:aspartyl/glutamyl-tRNA(Asn/Gln) amidotransferase C subunit